MADEAAEKRLTTKKVVGRKIGMTRIFTEDGVSTPVTVIEVEPNRVVAVRTKKADGYCAVQVTMGSRKASRLSKAEAGHFAKVGVEAGCGLWELSTDDDRVNEVLEAGVESGLTLTVAEFEEGQKVDVTGCSKGKGFQGGVKRYNFRTQDASHGNSLSHRANGSIGQCQTPGRVFKGKKMSGRMGGTQVTAQTLIVVRVDESCNLLFIKGSVPGAPGGIVIVRSAVKLKNPRGVKQWS